MSKAKKKPKPRKIKGVTPKQNKWNNGQFARMNLLRNRHYYKEGSIELAIKNRQLGERSERD